MRCTATNKSTGRQCKYEAGKGKRRCGVHANNKGKSSRKRVNLLPADINESTPKQTILKMVLEKAQTADKSVLLKALDVLNIESLDLDDDNVATTTMTPSPVVVKENQQLQPLLDDEVLFISSSPAHPYVPRRSDKININKMKK